MPPALRVGSLLPTGRRRARGRVTPVEYALLGFAVLVLVTVVFVAVGQLVSDSMDAACEAARGEATVATADTVGC